MKLKEIRSDVELNNYRHAIANHIDVLLPLDYLKQGRVFGYYNRSGKICGGFALITNGPFRVLDSIPNFKELTIDPNLEKTAEITGIWLSREEKKRFSSAKFWINVILKVMTSRKKYFVYAYSSSKTGLAKIYQKAKPEVLFRGETMILPGMPAPDHESVEVVFRSRIIKEAIKNPDFFIKKIIKFKRKNKIKKEDFHESKNTSDCAIISSLIELWPCESSFNR